MQSQRAKELLVQLQSTTQALAELHAPTANQWLLCLQSLQPYEQADAAFRKELSRSVRAEPSGCYTACL